MKPERCRELLKSTGLARAKMYLKAHLEWLDGYPYGHAPGQIHWRTRPQVGSPDGTRLIVDRERLKRSQAALTKLVRHFPRAMPKLVGDVANWSASVSAMLQRLKAAVHGGTDLSGDDAVPIDSLSRSERILIQQLSREPSFRPLLRAVTWSGCYAPDVRRFLLTWLAGQAGWIPRFLQHLDADVGLTSIVVAGDLAMLDGEECQNLLDVTLAQTDYFRTTTVGLRQEVSRFAGRLRDWRDHKAMPPAAHTASVTPYGVQMIGFLSWLAVQDRPVRRQATRLANLVLAIPVIQQWDASWTNYLQRARHGIRELCGLAKRLQGVAFHAEACRVSHELEGEFPSEPLCYPVHDILNRVKDIATKQSARLNRCLAGILAAIPIEQSNGSLDQNGWALRLALLREADGDRATFGEVRYYELFHQYLQSSATSIRLRPWSGLSLCWRGQARHGNSPRLSICDELRPQSRWPQYFELLHRVETDPDYAVALNDELAWLLSASDSVDQAYVRFRALAPGGLLNDATEAQIEAAIELESAQFPLAEMLTLVGTESRFQSHQLRHLLELHRAFAKAGWIELIPTLLQLGQGAELERAASQFEIASAGSSLSIPRRDVAVVVPDWAAALPKSLQRSVAKLLAIYPQNKTRVQRILSKNFPDHEALRSEIAVLQQLEGRQLPYSSTSRGVPQEIKRQRRLENLIRRLETPIEVAETTVARLCRELDNALLLDVFHEVNRQIDTRVITLLAGPDGQRHFDFDRLPASHMELIRGVLGLGEPYRGYALRLLRHEWGGIHWDLLHEPANQQFQQELTSRGVSLAPWLSDRTRQIAAMDGHPALTLAFASRPVDKLLMGYHFGTCLSPDGCNFFSAVVNAIDVNKRILYGRSDSGDVIGRCLFAIGDAGTIVAYRPYCHDTQFHFEEHVRQFANDLAGEMGTVVSHTDHVSPVVAPDWYDDGACDLGNSIAGDDSPIRQVLRNATEATLLEDINTALSPRRLTASMLELIVELPEFQAQPNLIRPLLRLIQEWESEMATTTLIAASRLADRIGLTGLAGKWLARCGFNWLCCNLRGYRYGDALQVVRLMIKYRASLALRALRATRSCGVNCDRDELDDARRQLLAECFDALARPRLAAEMRAPLTPTGRGAVDD